jgi:ankyrin repeat protein
MNAKAVFAVTGLLALGASFTDAALGAQSLADLIRDGNREAVLAAITSPDINVDAAEPDGSTALLWATYQVDHELVRALLKKGAKVNVTNDYGASPLSEAAKLGDVELTRTLLEARADPNSPNQDGETALMLASSVGSRRVAELLIARGANIDAVENYRGQTALMWAAAEDHPDVVELLLAHGANVGRRARSDDWPRQMTSEPRAQFRATGGLTALLYATRSGCYRCVVALVKAGADVNQPNPDGITPLINAIDGRSFDSALFLLDHGARPGAWDMYGRTPLYCAIDLNSWKPRAAGGPGGFAGYPGATALHAPNKATAMQIADRLLGMGVDPNHELTRMRPNGNGRGRFEDYMMRGGTGPLMVATLGFDEVAIKALLAHGAEVDEPNDFQITPLMAASGMHGSVHTTLDPPQREDIQEAAVRTIDLLLAGGANLNARVAGGRTRTAKMTAYIQGRDHEGQTALFAAAEAGWDQVTRHLVERGADPTLRDADGKTAVDYARSPRPAGTGVVWADPARAAAARAATVAYLESLAPKHPRSPETAMSPAGGLH